MSARHELVIDPARDMGYVPYPHQKKLFRHFLGEKLDSVLPNRRAALCWHRRAGKDHTCLALLVMAAMIKPGAYLHTLPEEKQARKVIWETPTSRIGRPIIDQVIPEELIARDSAGRLQKNNSKMVVTFKNGSQITLGGFDNYSSLLGTDYVGMVFSEYAVSRLADLAWRQAFLPILAVNEGFAVFISTPRGHNHFYDMFTNERHQGDSDWLMDKKTCLQTKRHDGTPIITMEQARNQYEDYDEAMLQQEFMCSWESPFSHAIYTEAIAAVYREKRYLSIPHNTQSPCVTAWDLGLSDDNFIIIAQPGPTGTVDIIDALWGSDKTLTSWIKALRDLPYSYVEHYGPHDLAVREYAQRGDFAVTRKDIAADLGFYFTVLKRLPVEDGIAAARGFFSRCRFNKDSRGVQRLWESLKAYVREQDDETKDQKPKPKKGWQCHGADAFRHLALGFPGSEMDDEMGVVVNGKVYMRRGFFDKRKVPPKIGSIMDDRRKSQKNDPLGEMYSSDFYNSAEDVIRRV